jgi:hypothetical protein
VRLELAERRVLGAVRFLDATTRLPVRSPLAVTGGDGVRLVRNRQGLWVLLEAPGLEEHTESFLAPPSEPAVGSVPVELTVSDPGDRYLPRLVALRLPRDPDPDHAEEEDSLFRPVDALLYPAPAASVMPGWAVIRATVVRAGSREPLAGALLRVVRQSDGEVLARALTDWRDRVRGEALVAVPGVPVTTWGEGEPDEPVLVHEVPVSLEAFFDPAFDPDAGAGGRPPDPDRLETQRAGLPSATEDLMLASGRTETKTLTVAVP